ncbi:hypothetical protein SAMN04487905_102202 [Actinopolyspora xinjiangensis]|uniref:Uncharacterized protein n=1 Tax=Actinopolyspora xinjiangensis TaxID=405564 RepID=A0A1H0QGE6_9ACTN|nr:hypothetical protein SAMN04487905_102202 [Actinopolyspora xinjiangensis]
MFTTTFAVTLAWSVLVMFFLLFSRVRNWWVTVARKTTTSTTGKGNRFVDQLFGHEDHFEGMLTTLGAALAGQLCGYLLGGAAITWTQVGFFAAIYTHGSLGTAALIRARLRTTDRPIYIAYVSGLVLAFCGGLSLVLSETQ